MHRQFDRLAVLATTATVVVMFFAISAVSPALRDVSATYKALSLVVGVLLSAGLYRAISTFLYSLFKRSRWLRKRVLGPAFLEGTWVGFFPHSGRHHFTVEFFNQESGSLQIKGREFDADWKTYANWTAETCSIDVANEKLIYAYTCSVFGRSHEQKGIGIFDLINKRKKPPYKLDGYAQDLVDGEKDPNAEYKISDEKVDDEEAKA